LAQGDSDRTLPYSPPRSPRHLPPAFHAMALPLLLLRAAPFLLYAAADTTRCGLSLVQLQARPARVDHGDPNTSNDTNSAQAEGDFNKTLEAVNASAQDVVAVLAYVNQTAVTMLASANIALDYFSREIPGLIVAVDAMKNLPGGDEYAVKVDPLIGKANKTLKEFKSQLSKIPSMIQKFAEETIPPLMNVADKLIDQFTDAALTVRDLQNLKAQEATEAAAKEEEEAAAAANESSSAESADDSADTPSTASLFRRKVAKAARPLALHGRMLDVEALGAVRKTAIESVLRERALCTHGEGHASFDRATSSKKKPIDVEIVENALSNKIKDECTKVAKSIEKVDNFRENFKSKMESLESSVSGFLDSIVDVVESGMGGFDDMLDIATEAAKSIPDEYLEHEPVTERLTQLVKLGNLTVQKADAAMPNITAKLEVAYNSLDGLGDFASQLEDQTHEACAESDL